MVVVVVSRADDASDDAFATTTRANANKRSCRPPRSVCDRCSRSVGAGPRDTASRTPPPSPPPLLTTCPGTHLLTSRLLAVAARRHQVCRLHRRDRFGALLARARRRHEPRHAYFRQDDAHAGGWVPVGSPPARGGRRVHQGGITEGRGSRTSRRRGALKYSENSLEEKKGRRERRSKQHRYARRRNASARARETPQRAGHSRTRITPLIGAGPPTTIRPRARARARARVTAARGDDAGMGWAAHDEGPRGRDRLDQPAVRPRRGGAAPHAAPHPSRPARPVDARGDPQGLYNSMVWRASSRNAGVAVVSRFAAPLQPLL